MTATLMISESTALPAGSHVERMTGIEPALSAWEADVLPLNYIRGCAARVRRVSRCPCPHIVQEETGAQTLLCEPDTRLTEGESR
jgi:hypothetical protein